MKTATGLALGGCAFMTSVVLFRCHTPPPVVKTMIKTSNIHNNKEIIINKNDIRWMSRKDECYYVCTNKNGCMLSTEIDDKW